ncbi:MAG: response regulator [Minicystis sp.]
MRKRKILLVDDSEISREMIRFILESRGWEVVTLTAPFLFVSTLSKEKPDLALIEVALRALSGDQLVRLSRMNGRAPCPLVLHADRPVDELRELARASGADGFIVKSGSGDQLIMNLEYFLRFGTSRDAEPPSSRTSAEAPPPSSRSLPGGRGEATATPPSSRRSTSAFEPVVPLSSRRMPASADVAAGLENKPKRGGSGLYQAVVAALEIPPSSTRDQPPSTRRSGQLAAVSAPTPPAPPASPMSPMSPTPEPPPRRPVRTKTLS